MDMFAETFLQKTMMQDGTFGKPSDKMKLVLYIFAECWHQDGLGHVEAS